MKWNDVEAGFQAAMQAAWESYCNGSIPIGASILNCDNEIVSIGRNRIKEKSAPNPQIFNHQLAHAEINAILQLSEVEHPDIRKYILYSVMEPCPLCLGAIAMGSIKYVKFAARDGWGGATSLVSENKYLYKKNIHIEGPFMKLEEIVLTWIAYFELENSKTRVLLDNWSTYCPRAIKTAEELFQTKELHKLRGNKAKVEEVFECTISLQNKIK